VKHLIISETASSIWHYHLRLVEKGEEKYGGNAGLSLCGKKLGWDTQIPLRAYGMKNHVRSNYCEECKKIALKAQYPEYEKIKE